MSTIAELSQARINPVQVGQSNAEGYFIFNEPVLPEDKFTGLKNYFETILVRLPPDQRPEAMDVPHFMHPELLQWAFDDPLRGTSSI